MSLRILFHQVAVSRIDVQIIHSPECAVWCARSCVDLVPVRSRRARRARWPDVAGIAFRTRITLPAWIALRPSEVADLFPSCHVNTSLVVSPTCHAYVPRRSGSADTERCGGGGNRTRVRL